MNILFMSKEGDGLGVAQRLALEGHEVSVWIADKRFARAGRGIVRRVPAWPQAARRADFIIADCVGLGRLESTLQELRKPLLGFCGVLDKVELDRAKGIELFQHAGVQVPETHPFASAADARRSLSSKEFKDGWVIKPSGNQAASKTAVLKHPELLDHALSQIPPESRGILQRVVNGVEVSTEAWFNGKNFIRPFNHTFEEKRFLAGGLGPNTGCMGNVVVSAGDGNRLTAATVERMEGLLRALDYRGPLDINCIVNQEGAHALEFTSRMGYDAVEALLEGLDEPAGDFLYDVATGAKRSMKLTDDTMIAVALSIPPWPNRLPDLKSEGEPILGVSEDNLPHLFLCDVQKEGEKYETAGCEGKLLVATAIGRRNTPKDSKYKIDYTYEARRRVYRTLDRISVSGKQYRTDIGERVNSDIAKLKEWGWL